MSDYNDQTRMEAVITRVAATPEPRLRQILTSLVTHLHGSLREVRPTWEELLAGSSTAVGQKCDDERQEFMLLSDTLGVSMLVDLINHGKVGNATESTVLGPAWVGRFAKTNGPNLRARLRMDASGHLVSQTYLVSQTDKEGWFLKSGDVLSQVDPRPFHTTVTHEGAVHD